MCVNIGGFCPCLCVIQFIQLCIFMNASRHLHVFLCVYVFRWAHVLACMQDLVFVCMQRLFLWCPTYVFRSRSIPLFFLHYCIPIITYWFLIIITRVRVLYEASFEWEAAEELHRTIAPCLWFEQGQRNWSPLIAKRNNNFHRRSQQSTQSGASP